MACSLFPSEQLGRAYPQKELYISLFLVLTEFYKTEGSQISRIQFRKVLTLLESHNRISSSEKESFQTAFDRRINKESFYDLVHRVQQLAADLKSDLEAKIYSNAPTGKLPLGYSFFFRLQMISTPMCNAEDRDRHGACVSDSLQIPIRRCCSPGEMQPLQRWKQCGGAEASGESFTRSTSRG